MAYKVHLRHGSPFARKAYCHNWYFDKHLRRDIDEVTCFPCLRNLIKEQQGDVDWHGEMAAQHLDDQQTEQNLLDTYQARLEAVS